MLVVAFTSCNKDNNSDEIYPTESLLSVTTDLNEMLSRAAMPPVRKWDFSLPRVI